MKPIAALLILHMMAHVPLAQDRMENPIVIEPRSQTELGKIDFYAHNLSHVPYAVIMDFTLLLNYEPSARVPFIFNAPPAPRRVFSLRVRTKINPSDYSYTLTYAMGCVRTKPSELDYGLPVAEGTPVIVTPLPYGALVGESEPPASWYALGFQSDEGPIPVVASRKGRVVGIQADGRVLVAHQDCTFASYSGLSPASLSVRDADQVVPGQPIGMATERLGLMVYYRDDRTLQPYQKKTFTGHSWIYLKPEFWTTDGRTTIDGRQTLRSAYPDELVTKEMTRAERRRRGK
jgi:hypothetical protein